MKERLAVWMATIVLVGAVVAIPVLVATGGPGANPYPVVPVGSGFVNAAPPGSSPSYADGYDEAVNFLRGTVDDNAAGCESLTDTVPGFVGENPSQFQQGCLAAVKR